MSYPTPDFRRIRLGGSRGVPLASPAVLTGFGHRSWPARSTQRLTNAAGGGRTFSAERSLPDATPTLASARATIAAPRSRGRAHHRPEPAPVERLRGAAACAPPRTRATPLDAHRAWCWPRLARCDLVSTAALAQSRPGAQLRRGLRTSRRGSVPNGSRAARGRRRHREQPAGARLLARRRRRRRLRFGDAPFFGSPGNRA